MNTIVLVGRIGIIGDLETVTFSGGSFNKVKFSVADNTFSKGKKETTWFNCEVSGKQSENFLKTCTKGTLVSVTGSMSSYKSEKNQQTYWTLRASGFERLDVGTAKDIESAGNPFSQTPNVPAPGIPSLDEIPF